MRRYRSKLRRIMSRFKSHKHRVGPMRGLTSIPVRFRGRRV